MAVPKYAEPDRTILRAFYVQYVAVLLILLSGMIGSLAGNAKGRALSTAPVIRPHVARESFFEFEVMPLFRRGTDRLEDIGALDTMVQIGLNHDVDLEISVPLPIGEAIDVRTSPEKLSTRRASAIARYLTDQGVPPSAIKSWANLESQQASKVRIRLQFRRGHGT